MAHLFYTELSQLLWNIQAFAWHERGHMGRPSAALQFSI